MAKTASSVAQRWAQRVGGAAEAYREGVNSVTVSPGQSAIEGKQRYLEGVTRAFNDGTYEKGLRSFSLEEWKQAAIAKGALRLASGAQAALPKVQRFQEFWLPQMEEMKRRIGGMSKGSLQDSQMRAAAAIAFNAALKGKAPRG